MPFPYDGRYSTPPVKDLIDAWYTSEEFVREQIVRAISQQEITDFGQVPAVVDEFNSQTDDLVDHTRRVSLDAEPLRRLKTLLMQCLLRIGDLNFVREKYEESNQARADAIELLRDLARATTRRAVSSTGAPVDYPTLIYEVSQQALELGAWLDMRKSEAGRRMPFDIQVFFPRVYEVCNKIEQIIAKLDATLMDFDYAPMDRLCVLFKLWLDIESDRDFERIESECRNSEVVLRAAIRDLNRAKAAIERGIRSEAEQLARSGENLASQTAVRPKGEHHKEFSHSDDYRTVALAENLYSLTTKQAAVIQCLHENAQRGVPDVAWETLKTAAGITSNTGARIRDTFRSLPNWKTLIVNGRRRGAYRLNI
ncbi:MAG: hypothetical protein HZB26_07550 [Candidatus Hydrogenedentes bacterium]|nr:hypothetical protein [Candidatus Hydrogenedentota bacterium]